MEQTTSFIKSIPEFADSLIALLQSPYGWVVFLVVLVWLLVNKNTLAVLGHFSKRETLRQEKLDAYLEKPELSISSCNSGVATDRLSTKFQFAHT